MTTVTQSRGSRSTRPAAAASGRRSWQPRGILTKAVVVLVFLLAWHFTVALWLPSYLPTPLGVLGAIVPTMRSAEFGSAVGDSAVAIVVGLAVGSLLGTALGLVSGRLLWLRQLLSPYINGLYALPLLAIVPPTTIWLGYTGDARLALIIVAAFLPCAVSTADGASAVPSSLNDVVEVYRVPPVRRLFDLVLPSSLPFVIAGLHVAVGRAIIAAVSVEFIAGLDGLGTFVLLNARSFNQNTAFVGVLVLALFGGLARLAIVWALRRAAPWHTQ